MDRRRVIIAAALTGLALASSASSAQAQTTTTGKEKCYGIAQQGKNDCAAADGSHSCKGQAKVSYYPYDWKFVAKGTCLKEGGTTTPKPK